MSYDYFTLLFKNFIENCFNFLERRNRYRLFFIPSASYKRIFSKEEVNITSLEMKMARLILKEPILEIYLIHI